MPDQKFLLKCRYEIHCLHSTYQLEVGSQVRKLNECNQLQTGIACRNILFKVPIRYRPNAASGGWSIGHDYVMMT